MNSRCPSFIKVKQTFYIVLVHKRTNKQKDSCALLSVFMYEMDKKSKTA